MTNFNNEFLDSPDDVSFEEAMLAEIDAEAEQAHWEEDLDYAALYSPVEQGMYDDDPNPYHGDYSDGGDYGWYDG